MKNLVPFVLFASKTMLNDNSQKHYNSLLKIALFLKSWTNITGKVFYFPIVHVSIFKTLAHFEVDQR